MNKKRYIEKLRQTILNRVRFHAPVLYDDNVDKRTLVQHGLDINKPIFKFDKKLNSSLVKAFELAKKDEDFNLVIDLASLGKMKEDKVKKMLKCIFYSEYESASFLQNINKLNINYKSSSNYNVQFKEKFFKFNGNILNPKYDTFCLSQTSYFDDVLLQHKEFVLNGINAFEKIYNSSKNQQKITYECNFSLKKGYYFFKKCKSYVLIENLITKEKKYLNYCCKNAKFSFSQVDGLENSSFSCVNIKIKTTLNPGEHKCIFFNFGEAVFSVHGECMAEKLFLLSKKFSCEIFNLQVKTKNPKFDLLFNKTLPQKIWLNWLNDSVDSVLEEKYLAYKRLFIKGTDVLHLVPFKEIGVREIGVFNGMYYKKIAVISADSQYMQVGKIKYFALAGVNRKMLSKREPISVSFG